jgi:hypothetical protein
MKADLFYSVLDFRLFATASNPHTRHNPTAADAVEQSTIKCVLQQCIPLTQHAPDPANEGS